MGAFSKWLAAAALACVAVSAAHADPIVERPPTDASAIRWDPAIRHGVLPNGLRYAVMQNATPTGGVSIRLAVEVGSLDETQGERGAAHFLEHMAFGGSKAQLQADVEKTFADAGVAFGRDRNAATGLRETTYRIDLPHGDPAALDLGFKWLRQVADGALLTDETVERERGVIQAEREARLSDALEVSQAIAAFQAPKASSALRDPIGTQAQIAAVSAPLLQSFYDRWYQPANAVVVVVGDGSLDALEARTRAAFQSWRQRPPPPPRAAAAPVDESRAFDAFTLASANVAPSIGLCRLRNAPLDADQDMAGRRLELETQIWSKIVGDRLTADAGSVDSGLVSAAALSAVVRGEAKVTCLGGVGAAGQWSPGLKTFSDEVRRLIGSPPSEAELEKAVRRLRADMRAAISGRATRASADLATAIAKSLLEGRAAPSPFEAMRVFDVAVEDLTPADIQAAFARDWSGSGPLATVVTGNPPTAEAVRQSWAGFAASALAAAPAAGPEAVWNYVAFGRPGRVVKRETVGGVDFVRVTFANGVRVNIKHTAFRRGEVVLRLRFGAGLRELPPDEVATAIAGAGVFERGGLSRNSYSDIQALFAEWGLHVKMAVLSDGFLLGAEASPRGLTPALQILAGYVTEPAFQGLDVILPASIQSTIREARGRPLSMVRETLEQGVEPDPPAGLRALRAAAGVKGVDVARVLKPALTQAPLELSVVGDVDEAEVIDAVGRTLGALPARKAGLRDRADTPFLRFPEPPPLALAGVHEAPAEKAAVALVWPLYVADPARRREEYALQLLARVYRQALLRRVRAELGKTYAPSASTSMPDHSDQGYLVAQAEIASVDVDLVKAEMTAIAARLAAGGFTDDDVETVRKPYLAELDARFQTNEWWATVLENTSRDDVSLTDAETMRETIAGVTAEEVRKAAANWLSRPPISVTVTADPAAAGPKP
jgi:zinc protease